jgi:hypothetical protein
MSEPIDESVLPEIAVKARRAIKEAAAAAIAEHWRNGRPVYVWQDEQVMALHPDGTAVPYKPGEGAPGEPGPLPGEEG